jgi:hypothetical protein
MKEKVNETSLGRRARCQHGRVRDYHFGSCWLCRSAADNSAKSRGKADADGSNQVSPHSQRHWLDQQGSVTAEFAIILPGVLLILFLALSVQSLQSSRMALVELAAEGSRALARGESKSLVTNLISQSGLGPSVSFEVIYQDLSVCVEVLQTHQIKALGGLAPIELKEVQCSRKGGL